MYFKILNDGAAVLAMNSETPTEGIIIGDNTGDRLLISPWAGRPGSPGTRTLADTPCPARPGSRRLGQATSRRRAKASPTRRGMAMARC
jgi:hypothetical protein